ncbi:hypothetical protein Tco_0142224 [Tanacetum coccineum]
MQSKQVQSTESHKDGDEREQNMQTSADSDSRQNTRFRQHIQTDSNREFRTKVDEEQKQIHIQQRGLNRGRKRVEEIHIRIQQQRTGSRQMHSQM